VGLYRTQSGELVEAVMQSEAGHLMERRDPGFERGIGVLEMAAEKAASGKGTEAARAIGHAFLLMYPTFHDTYTPIGHKNDWLAKIQSGAKALTQVREAYVRPKADEEIMRAAHLCRKALRDFSQVKDPAGADVGLLDLAYREMHGAMEWLSKVFAGGPAHDALYRVWDGLGQIHTWFDWTQNDM
jgi:hypothetical protein